MSRSRLAALVLALLTAVSIWLSAGILFIGDAAARVAALPALSVLAVLAVALPAAAWIAKLRLEHAWPLALSLLIWLPFLPIGGSAIWDGPIEGIVWLVVIAGLIAVRPPAAPAALSSPGTAPWMAALAIAIASLAVFSQVRNVIPGGDEPHYLAATQSLIHDGDLKVANNYQQGDYLDYFPGQLEPHFLKRSTSGEIYSIHAPGVSVVVLPAFAIAGYAGAVWMMVLIASATAALMWRVAFAMSQSAAAAWIAVCGVCLSTPFFFHTFTIYPEMIGALCVMAGVWLLIEVAQRRDPSDRALIGVGALLALLPWLHTRFAVLAGIIGILISLRLAARPAAARRIGVFLAAPVVAAIAWFSFFFLIWGSPSPTAPYGADTSTSASYVLRGLIGLLFDQQFGVITTAPIYAMTIVGAVVMLRTHRREAIELALIVIPYAIAVASYAMWWGGAAAPGRFLVAILPIAALPIAAAYASSRTIRAVSLILVVISAALVLPRAFEDNGRFIYNNRSGVDATLRWLSAVDLSASLPSVHRSGGSAAVRSGLVWLTGLAAVIAAARWMSRHRSSGARFAITGAMLALAVVACAPIAATWAIPQPPTPPPLMALDVMMRPPRWLVSTHRLVTLERLRPWHTTIVDTSSWQSISAADLLNRLPIALAGPSLERVPAGEYRVTASAGSTIAGPVRISIGRTDGVIEELRLDDPHASATFRLPVMARALNFRAQQGGTDALALQPIALVSPASRLPATRAARYGNTRAFFFDDWLYPERDGFWTRANGSGTVVIYSPKSDRQSGLPISVIAGLVPTTIALSVGDWEERLALATGEKREVMLPAADSGTWRLTIRSGDGFRPSERDPGSRDVRSLAAWIAIP